MSGCKLLEIAGSLRQKSANRGLSRTAQAHARDRMQASAGMAGTLRG